MKILLRGGACKSVKNKRGQTAEQLAAFIGLLGARLSCSNDAGNRECAACISDFVSLQLFRQFESEGILLY